MKIILQTLIFFFSFVITTNGFALETLEKGKKKGRIKFESVPVITLSQFLKGETNIKSIEIHGQLKFPKKKLTEPLPAVVLLHGSGGPRKGVKYWSKILEKLGLVTFIVDSNSARGCPLDSKSRCKNYSEHQGMANIVDAYRALELLSTHPQIDSNRIALMGFSVGGKATLYASVKRFQKMWGTPGLEFAAYIPFYPACNIAFDHDEKISDKPVRIFYGELDEWSSPIPCQEYVNRLRKAGKDATITIYPGAHHNFDHKPDANAPRSMKSTTVRSKCRFVEAPEYNLVVLEKDKNNSELEELYTQCTSMLPNRKRICRINAYVSLQTSNMHEPQTREHFIETVKKFEEGLCNMEHETKQTSGDNSGGGGLELDKKYAVAVEKFITKEWGKSDWEMGFIKCMIGHAASLSEEVKEAVIEHGPEKAFKKISNEKDMEVYSKVFSACEKNSEAALAQANRALDEAAKQETTSESSSEISQVDLPSFENQLVKQAENYDTAFLMTDTSCMIESKKRLRYNKEAAEKAKKAVVDFLTETIVR